MIWWQDQKKGFCVDHWQCHPGPVSVAWANKYSKPHSKWHNTSVSPSIKINRLHVHTLHIAADMILFNLVFQVEWMYSDTFPPFPVSSRLATFMTAGIFRCFLKVNNKVSKVPVEHLLFLHLQKSRLWPQWGDESKRWASAVVSILFIFWFRSKKRGFLGYVQVQEIDSIILKIQWQSFITFLSLFPFSFVEWKKNITVY